MPAAIGYLLDTNIVVHLIRGNPLAERIDAQFNLRSGLSRCIVCVVTVGECLSLARGFAWGAAKTKYLKQVLETIPWVDINHPDVLDAYADIDQAGKKRGLNMGKNDVWIAATARATGNVLLTTDQDFDHLHGTWINRVWINPDLQGSA